MNKIVLFGGGGHALSVLDVIQSTNDYKVLGYFDVNNEQQGQLGIPYLGPDELFTLEEYPNVRAAIGVGQIDSPDIRRRVYEMLKAQHVGLPTIVSPTAYVSPRATLEEGVIVHHGATVGPLATVGVSTIINTQCNIDHGAQIGSFCHISTGAMVNGDVVVENNCFIGSNATLKQGLHVQAGSKISMGATLLKTSTPGGWYLGNPARKYKI